MCCSFTDDEHGPDAKIYHVFGKGPGGDKCDYWCDGQGDLICNEGESLCQIDYVKSAKFESTLTLNGSLVDKFV